MTVQLGQCGNQIGTQLFSTLHEDATSCPSPSTYRQLSLDRFFYREEEELGGCRSRDLKARAVLFDMESKVVQHSLTEAKKTGKWRFDTNSTYSEKRGSGNNWANGYLNHAPSVMGVVLERVRRQVERCDWLDGFLILMSVAGGTGSGVGARLTESLREAYPHSTLVNPTVWPYISGEVIVQDYNSLLTTAHLQASSDAVLLLQNQAFHQVCTQLLHLREVTLTDINKVISHALASALQPATPFDAHSSATPTQRSEEDPLMYSRCRLSDLVTSLCPHPHYKFLTLKTIPQMPDSTHAYSHFLWAGLLKHLRQMLMTDSPTEEGMDWGVALPTMGSDFRSDGSGFVGNGSCLHGDGSGFRGNGINKSLANLLILRGNELNTVDRSSLSDPRLYSGHAPSSCTCSVWCCKHSFNRYEKCCTLVSNSQSCLAPLDRVCGKAWRMFSARAYLHQYAKHNFTQEDFLKCFISVEQTLKDYTAIS